MSLPCGIIAVILEVLLLAEADATLVQKALAGNTQAFGELYDRYAALIRVVCFNSTNEYGAAQDLTQEVFLRAYSKLEFLKETDRFGPWLVSIAKNVGREFRRGKARDRHLFVGLEPPDEQAQASDDTADKQLWLERALAELDEDERLALQVHYLKGKDADEGKAILKISRSSYYRLLERAKTRVGKLIEQYEGRDKK